MSNSEPSAIVLHAIPCIGGLYTSFDSNGEIGSVKVRRDVVVVIIELGTVITAMYDKSEKEDLSEFNQTEYWEALQNFQKFIVPLIARLDGARHAVGRCSALDAKPSGNKTDATLEVLLRGVGRDSV
jgi:hypothetical protein